MVRAAEVYLKLACLRNFFSSFFTEWKVNFSMNINTVKLRGTQHHGICLITFMGKEKRYCCCEVKVFILNSFLILAYSLWLHLFLNGNSSDNVCWFHCWLREKSEEAGEEGTTLQPKTES